MNGRISRRQALVGAAGLAGAALAGVDACQSYGAGTAVVASGAGLIAPKVLASRNGVLSVRLRAARGVRIAGRATHAMGYNGSSPGPTLRVRPGDRLEIELVNALDTVTNLHTHGLHVSPRGSSDNVFRRVQPGQTARYVIDIPDDHPSGTFWYHPHVHMHVADQVFGGLFGALVVARPEDDHGPTERLMVISDITLTGGGAVAAVDSSQLMTGREGQLVLVNGQRHPVIHTTSDRTERWRIVNACASRFLKLQVDGHSLGLLGLDGQALGAPRKHSSVTLPPGGRADLLFRPGDPGSLTFRTLTVDRGGMGGMGGGSGPVSTATTLATVKVGRATSATPSRSLTFPRRPDLRAARVSRRRTLNFTMGMGGGMGGGSGRSFGFDGRAFDPSRIDQHLQLGTVEEWVIDNTTMMAHPFHLHVWPMQILQAPDHDPSGPPDWRDVVIVPAGGQVRIRVRVNDFTGKTVYHCHILDHEDHGMMGIAEASD